MRAAVLISFSVIAAFLFLARRSVIYGPYFYDEADYMYAASLGFAANYTDSPTLSLIDFAKIGLHRGRDSSRRSELSEMIRASNDIVFYRHWHGPAYIDWLLLVKGFGSSEHDLRELNYVFPVATALLMIFGAIWIIPGVAGRVTAALASVLYLWSVPVVRTTELAPHLLFGFFVVAALLLLAKMMAPVDGGAGDSPATSARLSVHCRRYWYLAVIATALAFCTLEVALMLIATLLLCGHAVRDRLEPDLAFALKSAAAFLATVFIVWPAAILKLSFVKAYAFMAYLAIFRKAAWGSNISVAGAWWLRIISSPVVWIALGVAVALLLSRRVKWSPILLPFAIYSVSMFLAIFRVNTETHRYVLPLLPGIVLLAAFALGPWLASFERPVRVAALAVICFGMFFSTYLYIRPHPMRQDAKQYAMLDLVLTKGLSGKSLLVPHDDLPMIHYYFPHTRLAPYADEAEIPTDLRRSPVDGVIYRGDPPQYQQVSTQPVSPIEPPGPAGR